MLALFGREQQEEIIALIKNNSESQVLTLLDRRRNPMLPPGIISAVGSSDVLSDEQRVGAIWAFAALVADQYKNFAFSKTAYRKMLIDVFIIDEVYAERLASEVNTVDDAAGLFDNPAYAAAAGWSGFWNMLGMPNMTIDPNSKDDDIDRSWEFVELGRVILGLVTRAAVMNSSAASRLNTSMSTDVATIVNAVKNAEARRSNGEIGGLYEDEHAMRLLTPYKPLPIPSSEMGGFFDTLKNIGGKVLGVVSGITSVGAQILGEGKPKNAPAPAPQPRNDDTGGSASRAMDAIRANKDGSTMTISACN